MCRNYITCSAHYRNYKKFLHIRDQFHACDKGMGINHIPMSDISWLLSLHCVVILSNPEIYCSFSTITLYPESMFSVWQLPGELYTYLIIEMRFTNLVIIEPPLYAVGTPCACDTEACCKVCRFYLALRGAVISFWVFFAINWIHDVYGRFYHLHFYLLDSTI